MEDCKNAILLNPSFIKPYHRCAQALQFLEKWEDAKKILDRAVQVDKDVPEINALLGVVNKKLEEIAERKKQKKLEYDAKVCRI
jgi:hypothetical protein